MDKAIIDVLHTLCILLNIIDLSKKCKYKNKKLHEYKISINSLIFTFHPG